MHINCLDLILATRDTQFGQEVALVMQTTHAQCMRSADSIPIVSTSVCFLPLEMYTGITKILEFEYKTCFKRYHHDLLRHLVAF